MKLFLSILALFAVSTSNAGGLLLGQVDDVSGDKFTVHVSGHSLKIPYYSTHDLYQTNSDIDKVVIVIHGNNRDAGPYLNNMQIAASNTSENTANTLIIAPQFLIEDDIDFHNLDNQHLYWSSGGWKSGSNSRDETTNPRPARIPSYAVLDRLLLHIANQFPNVESIVFSGHSAGGQLTQRMAAVSPIADQICQSYNINMRFIVSNPSSYVYMNEERRDPDNIMQFITPTPLCSDYNEWKYGLEDLYTYGAAIGADSIRNMYPRRQVIYLIGADDNNPNSSSLDDSCEGMLQGDHRLQRAQIYYNYLTHYYDFDITENHDLAIVPNAGHNNLEMFNSTLGRFYIFEKPFSENCDSPVSTTEDLINPFIQISPNPASTEINIIMTDLPDQNGKLIIFDIKGRVVFRKKISDDTTIDISSFSQGVYIARVTSAEFIYSQKLIIN